MVAKLVAYWYGLADSSTALKWLRPAFVTYVYVYVHSNSKCVCQTLLFSLQGGGIPNSTLALINSMKRNRRSKMTSNKTLPAVCACSRSVYLCVLYMHVYSTRVYTAWVKGNVVVGPNVYIKVYAGMPVYAHYLLL